MNTDTPEIIVRDTYSTRVFSSLQANQETSLPVDQVVEILGSSIQLFTGVKIHLLQKLNDNTQYVYPVIIKEITPDQKSVVVTTDYTFNFADILKLIALDAEVRRQNWKNFSIKWIKNDKRGFIWYNTGDGYLPWDLKVEDVKANDWGIRFGYEKKNPHLTPYSNS